MGTVAVTDFIFDVEMLQCPAGIPVSWFRLKMEYQIYANVDARELR